MKEIEILVKVLEDKKTALAKLKRLASPKAKLVKDTYFFHPVTKRFLPKKGRLVDSFRLRMTGSSALLAYKKDNFNDSGKWVYSDEDEIQVNDVLAMRKIIENLGFSELVSIENKKTVFLIRNHEVVLEEVKDLGLFLEVERLGLSDSENINSAKRGIKRLIKSLGIKVGPELNFGKPELMLRKVNAKMI